LWRVRACVGPVALATRAGAIGEVTGLSL